MIYINDISITFLCTVANQINNKRIMTYTINKVDILCVAAAPMLGRVNCLL